MSKCQECKHYIAIFGAHRGGVYCQFGYPRVLYNLRGCEHFEECRGDKQVAKYPPEEYPGLLSFYELNEMRLKK
jgi:hypothetical protein